MEHTNHKTPFEEYINETRLAWWRPAHLGYILNAIGCRDIHTALDIGVGGGHWAALLFGIIQEPVHITGVDSEDHWVKSSQAYLDQKLPDHHYRAVKGQANRLPLPDESFDLVTCQTLLMHLSDPVGAVGEMLRVLKPGGHLLVAEPMNQLNTAVVSYGLACSNPEISNILWRVWRAFHERQRELGRGDNNIAARIPTILSGFKQIYNLQSFQSDVVKLFGPDHKWLSTLVDELRKDENPNLMRDAGISEHDINLAENALHSLVAKMNSRAEIIAWPTPVLLFTARKQNLGLVRE